MSFSLSVTCKEPTGLVLVAARGNATAADFPMHQNHFDAVLGAQWAAERVMVNMDEVPYLDSAAIGWLIVVQKQFRASGGKLVLFSVQPAVKNVLNLLKIERVVPLLADEKAARKHLRAPAAERAA